MSLPFEMVYQRVSIPRRLHDEPESGLEGLLTTLTSVALTVSGFHALGEMLHWSQTMAELEEALQPQPLGQSEMLARRSFAQNVGQPTFSTPNPMVMVDSFVPVRRPIDVLDPGLKVTNPGLAATYQGPSRVQTLGDRLRQMQPPSPAPASPDRRTSPTAWRIL